LLDQRYPNKFRQSQLSTISDKLRRWRHEHSLPVEFAHLKPWKKTNIEEVWKLALAALEERPNISARGLHRLLMEKYPEQVNQGQRTSILGRHKSWRQENMQKLEQSVEISSVSTLEEALSLVSQIKSTSKITNEATEL